MSDDDAIIRKLQSRAMTPTSGGFCVRQSEEVLKTLQKENFNLKLKIYFLESRNGNKSKLPPEVASICDKDSMELFLENESLRKDLDEKQELMTNALQVIELLERQKEEQLKESQVIIEENMRRIEALKVRSKINKRKMSKKHAEGENANLRRIQEEIKTYKTQNVELFARINDLKKENKNKDSLLDKLTAEKSKVDEKLDKTEKNLHEKDNIINSLTEKLREIPTNLTKLHEENKILKSKIDEISVKYLKLERECKDYQRIVQEQAEIMKTLNKVIEVKNDELDGYKANRDFSTSFIQEHEINLNGNVDELSTFPFHNPLFGSFQSLYR